MGWSSLSARRGVDEALLQQRDRLGAATVHRPFSGGLVEADLLAGATPIDV